MVLFLTGVPRVDSAVDKTWSELDDGAAVETAGLVVDSGSSVTLGLSVSELNRVPSQKKKGSEKDILHTTTIKKN